MPDTHVNADKRRGGRPSREGAAVPVRPTPDPDDVVVRPNGGTRSTVYMVGTPSHPDQFIVCARVDAVLHARAYARERQVRAWFADGDDMVLLGTFRREKRSS